LSAISDPIKNFQNSENFNGRLLCFSDGTTYFLEIWILMDRIDCWIRSTHRTSPFEYYWFSCHTCHVSTTQIHVNMQPLRFRSKREDYQILNYCFLIVSSSNQTTMPHVIVTHYCSYSCTYTTNQCLCLHYSIPVSHDYYCLKTHRIFNNRC